jgi:hypothetical protein
VRKKSWDVLLHRNEELVYPKRQKETWMHKNTLNKHEGRERRQINKYVNKLNYRRTEFIYLDLLAHVVGRYNERMYHKNKSNGIKLSASD